MVMGAQDFDATKKFYDSHFEIPVGIFEDVSKSFVNLFEQALLEDNPAGGESLFRPGRHG